MPTPDDLRVARTEQLAQLSALLKNIAETALLAEPDEPQELVRTTQEIRLVPICSACWRRDQELAISETANGMSLCPQCTEYVRTWFMYGNGSESATHGRRMVATWVGQLEPRTVYQQGLT